MSRPAWMARSRCASEFGPGFDREPVAVQIATCLQCPVRDQCLEYALEHETPSNLALTKYPSVWGATTIHQRRDLLDRRSAAA